MTKNFVHLHVHSSYSMLDGYNPADKAAKRAKELGMSAIAVTDHKLLTQCLMGRPLTATPTVLTIEQNLYYARTV
jgi:histidinol phosphatase-like PHP family hydrolase